MPIELELPFITNLLKEKKAIYFSNKEKEIAFKKTKIEVLKNIEAEEELR